MSPNSSVVNPHVADFMEKHMKAKTLLRKNAKNEFECKVCHLCDKQNKTVASNCWKLLVRPDGSYYCHRCSQGGSFKQLKQKLGVESTDIIQISAKSGSFETSKMLPDTQEVEYNRPDQSEARAFHTALFGDNNDDDNNNDDMASYRSMLETLPTHTKAQLDAAHALNHLLNVRCLSPHVLKRYRVGVGKQSFLDDQGSWQEKVCVTFPWIKPTENDPENIVRIKYRAFEQKGLQRMWPKGGEWGLFGWHTVFQPSATSSSSSSSSSSSLSSNNKFQADTLLITEGEYDCLAVAQAIDSYLQINSADATTSTTTTKLLSNIRVVSLPNGCHSLPTELLPQLASFQRIYLWLDNDAQGQQSVETFVNKLGAHRCWIIKPSADMINPPKDANDALRQVSKPTTTSESSQQLLGFEHTNTQLIIDMILSAQQPSHDRIETFSDRKEEVRSIASVEITLLSLICGK